VRVDDVRCRPGREQVRAILGAGPRAHKRRWPSAAHLRATRRSRCFSRRRFRRKRGQVPGGRVRARAPAYCSKDRSAGSSTKTSAAASIGPVARTPRDAGLRRIGQRPPTALGNFDDATARAKTVRRARCLGRRVRLLHVDPDGRARIVLLQLEIRREPGRPLRAHASGGSSGDRPGWRACAEAPGVCGGTWGKIARLLGDTC